MQSIGMFIVDNVNENLEQDLHHSVIQCGEDIGMSLNEMLDELFEVIEVKELKTFENNVGMQRKTIISFNYEGKKCEIGEHYGSQRDYFWVRVYAM